jgi:putative nucleotidyltransferase with HDIG domain
MATQDSEAQFIEINDLRVGMFVYLDLGWMKHPFTLNSFKITAHDQIDTLIKLGINRIRWSPEKSDLEASPAADPASANGSADTPADTPAGTKVGANGMECPAAGTATAREALAKAMAADAEIRRQRRECLNDQRESLDACERQFTSATRSYRLVIDAVRAQPEVARAQTDQVIDSMVGKMLEQEESAIRLLSENAGEKASLHSLNVTVISLLLGKAMGLDADALKSLGAGALLHDIGKIELPERLRWSDTHFNSAERKLYQEHVDKGIALGGAMRLSAGALAIVAQHHELIDGRGFPRQLTNEQISPLARIVALVNHYDNLCNPANPARAVTPHEALSQIFAQMKRQFDAAVLTMFIRMMGVYPPGSVVELTDGRLALVASVNSSRPLKPRIVIFEPRVAREEALLEDLEQSPDLGIRRSLKPLQLPKAAFDYLSPRQRICYFFERARDASQDGGAAR